MEQRAFEVLDAAWDAGIRYFDAARSYGRGEAFLGAWLRRREIPEGDAVVASKWGYTYAADWRIKAAHHEIKDHSLSVLQRQWRESRENLGDHLHLYQIHSATFDSGVLENREVHRELARLKGEGILIGLTLSCPRQAEVLERAMAASRYLPMCSRSHCAERGLGPWGEVSDTCGSAETAGCSGSCGCGAGAGSRSSTGSGSRSYQNHPRSKSMARRVAALPIAPPTSSSTSRSTAVSSANASVSERCPPRREDVTHDAQGRGDGQERAL
jgi:hypothetical protein